MLFTSFIHHKVEYLTGWNIVTLVQSKRIGRRNAVNGSLFPQTFINVNAAKEGNRLQAIQQTTEPRQ